jgi:hypothetical protein
MIILNVLYVCCHFWYMHCVPSFCINIHTGRLDKASILILHENVRSHRRGTVVDLMGMYGGESFPTSHTVLT